MLLSVMTTTLQAEDVLDKVYPIKFEDVVQESLSVSDEIAALQKELSSSKDLLEGEQAYYFPKVTLATELKRFYGAIDPAPDKTGELLFNVNAKVYGDKVQQKIDAAEKTYSAGEYALKNETLKLYYTVLKYMTKIERTRFYDYQASLLRMELESFKDKQANATRSGVSTDSNLKEVELIYARFNESVYGVTSAIDSYFKSLSQETGFVVVNPADVGLSYQRLSSLLDKQQALYDAGKIEAANFDFLAQKSTLESARLAAESQRERVKLSIVTENYLNLINETNNDFGGAVNKSYLGLRLDVDLFDHQKTKTQNAAFNSYYAQKHRFENTKRQLVAKYESLKTQYENLLAKRTFTLEQIRLSRVLIESQKRELITDKVTYLDIAKILLTFNDAFVSLNNLDIQIYETIYDLMLLQSEEIV